jgi:hypothetical protein
VLIVTLNGCHWERDFNGHSMSTNHTKNEAPAASLKNESARQRWDLFHRAIAHAKQSNDEALLDSDSDSSDSKSGGQLLSIVR